MMTSRSCLTTVLLIIASISACTGNTARLRNFQLQHELDIMEERIDMLEEQLESSSSTCISDSDCSGAPHCDGGSGCYCKLPMGVCNGDELDEGETGHCVKQRFGCNRSLKPVLGCDGRYYGNPSCAQAAAMNIMCDIRSDPDCNVPVPSDSESWNN